MGIRLFRGPKARFRRYHRWLVWSQRRSWWGLAAVLTHRIQQGWGVYLPVRQIVPLSTEFLHPTAIVIGEGIRIGARVKIYQGVTLGGARRGDWQAGNYPTIGDDVVLFAGAVVVGGVTIGNRCTVGANSVVLCDVPDGHTAVGAPARILPPKPPPCAGAPAGDSAPQGHFTASSRSPHSTQESSGALHV